MAEKEKNPNKKTNNQKKPRATTTRIHHELCSTCSWPIPRQMSNVKRFFFITLDFRETKTNGNIGLMTS